MPLPPPPTHPPTHPPRPQVAFPSFNAIGLATVCWGLASLNLRPPGFWVDELLGWALRALHKVPLVRVWTFWLLCTDLLCCVPLAGAGC